MFFRYRRATAQEYSIIGVILLLFGITWVAYAYQQPVLRYEGPGVCGTSPQGNIPPCTSLSPTATIFYVFGFAGIVVGAIFLLLRVTIASKDRTKGRTTEEAKAANR